MADAHAAHTQSGPPDIAYDRPSGQDDPKGTERPGARIAIKLTVALVSAIGLVSWIASVLIGDGLGDGRYPTLAIIVLFAIGSEWIPLQFAYKQEMTFEVVVTVLAAL